jgi:hypothetical protein
MTRISNCTASGLAILLLAITATLASIQVLEAKPATAAQPVKNPRIGVASQEDATDNRVATDASSKADLGKRGRTAFDL